MAATTTLIYFNITCLHSGVTSSRQFTHVDIGMYADVGVRTRYLGKLTPETVQFRRFAQFKLITTSTA